MSDKFVSIKRKDALALLEDEDYTTEVRKVGRHYFVKTDAPLYRKSRLFYDNRGRLVDNGPAAHFALTLHYSGQDVVMVDSEFVD